MENPEFLGPPPNCKGENETWMTPYSWDPAGPTLRQHPYLERASLSLAAVSTRIGHGLDEDLIFGSPKIC